MFTNSSSVLPIFHVVYQHPHIAQAQARWLKFGFINTASDEGFISETSPFLLL